MLFNLFLYAASDSVNIFFMRKVLHVDNDLRTARRRAGVFSRFDLGDVRFRFSHAFSSSNKSIYQDAENQKEPDKA
jgi:hypothetical protein